MDLFKKFLDSYHVKRIPKGEIILCQGEAKPLSFDAYLELFPTAWTFRKTNRARAIIWLLLPL